jgi:hypothetical protein
MRRECSTVTELAYVYGCRRGTYFEDCRLLWPAAYELMPNGTSIAISISGEVQRPIKTKVVVIVRLQNLCRNASLTNLQHSLLRNNFSYLYRTRSHSFTAFVTFAKLSAASSSSCGDRDLVYQTCVYIQRRDADLAIHSG